jgi:hypothetical protein
MKPFRCINARVDLAKVLFGPYIKAIEEVVFHDPRFIKKVPVPERFEYIRQKLVKAGSKYSVTDFTSFESTFNVKLMLAIELQVIAYVGRDLPNFKWFYSLFKSTVCGENHCSFRYFTAVVRATRMSGEMDTSLANGITNLVMLQFVGHKYGLDDVPCVVEGDDGMATWPLSINPSEKDWEEWGFKIKLAMYSNPFEGGFCGMNMDETSGVNCPDPSPFVAKFWWATDNAVLASARTQRMLLSAKALSAAYEYAGAPVVGSVVRAALRITGHEDPRPLLEKQGIWDNYTKERMEHVFSGITDAKIAQPVNDVARVFVERKYGMSISAQKKLERFFDGVLSPACFPVGELLTLPLDYSTMASSVRVVPKGFPYDLIHMLGDVDNRDPREVFKGVEIFE